MALNQSDILQHNNPNLAVVDSDFSKGGFRTAVASINDLYALSGKTDEPSAAGQLKEYATIVYVTGETKYYVLTDVDNVGNASGWSEFQTGGGTGTLSGATNGLGLTNSGTTVVLGGNLTGSTTIGGLGLHDFTFNNINDFQITPSGSSNITFGIDESGLLFTFTGGSVSYDSNAGLVYGDDYITTFINESLVSKRYVDTIAAGLHPKTAVLVATTGETLALSGTPVIDGVSLTTGDRVLVKDQTNDVDNGIYVVTGGTWSRSTDFDGSPEGEVEQGALVPIISGDTNASTQWILITKDPEVGTSGLTFSLFSTGSYSGGVGINISGSEISVNGASLVGNSLSWTANTFNVDPSTGTLATALGTKLDITDFNTFTGTTLPNNYYNETEINTYTGATDILIDTKLNTSTFTGYTATTQPVINGAITGGTNVGGGQEVYSGATDRLASFRTFVGSGDTTITTVGDQIVVYGSSGGTDIYTGESPAAIEVGGISIGTVLTGKTYGELFEELLVPELCGTVTAPSLSITLTETGLFEVGSTLSQTVTGDFDRGCIDPQYCSVSDKRSGLPNAYCFTGTGMPSGYQSCTTLSASQTNASYNVVIGAQSWGVQTRYDAGNAALGSKGTEYCAALPSGETVTETATICGVYPLWGTVASIGSISKVSPLYNMGTANNIVLELCAETSTDKQKFEVPCAWLGAPTSRPLNGISWYNDLSGSWVTETSCWVSSSATESVQGNTIGYCQYTYNGAQRGGICIRLEF